jgi:hypothetical protein
MTTLEKESASSERIGWDEGSQSRSTDKRWPKDSSPEAQDTRAEEDQAEEDQAGEDLAEEDLAEEEGETPPKVTPQQWSHKGTATTIDSWAHPRKSLMGIRPTPTVS